RSSVGLHIPPVLVTYPVNFGDPVFSKIVEKEGPFDIIANFAAHKHVRSEKDIYSLEAMFDNNVFKTNRLLEKIALTPPEKFFCVSTDKAANPVNLMGASKKLMEDVIMAYAKDIPVCTARFANVAFSNGSLPFGFVERLMKRQPLSAPHDIKRFLVTPDESGEICMLACLLGESGDIFFPALNAEQHMHTFTEIAEQLLAHCGFKPLYCTSEQEARDAAKSLHLGSKEYPVYFFKSDTSGEKPYEEFYTGDEVIDRSKFDSLGIIKNTPMKSLAEIKQQINHLESLFNSPDATKANLVETLQTYLGRFDHLETGKNLDQKM
ncbi:MAG: polysaccharide biosynthesis protein, partial [Saprospiraceae bacterium]|nr:polysaccharide biosynthesis protein [Saprospiraceae bacterium]